MPEISGDGATYMERSSANSGGTRTQTRQKEEDIKTEKSSEDAASCSVLMSSSLSLQKVKLAWDIVVCRLKNSENCNVDTVPLKVQIVG